MCSGENIRPESLLPENIVLWRKFPQEYTHRGRKRLFRQQQKPFFLPDGEWKRQKEGQKVITLAAREEPNESGKERVREKKRRETLSVLQTPTSGNSKRLLGDKKLHSVLFVL